MNEKLVGSAGGTRGREKPPYVCSRDQCRYGTDSEETGGHWWHRRRQCTVVKLAFRQNSLPRSCKVM